MKKIVVPAIAIVAVLVIGIILLNKDKEEKEVINYVSSNYIKLEEIANNYLQNNQVAFPKYIKNVNVYNGTKTTTVEFAVNDNYGFYYSTDNLPTGNKNLDVNLLGLGDNRYTWEDNNGKGIIQKIRDYWYFYKVTK